jgi:hypothetical protein
MSPRAWRHPESKEGACEECCARKQSRVWQKSKQSEASETQTEWKREDYKEEGRKGAASAFDICSTHQRKRMETARASERGGRRPERGVLRHFPHPPARKFALGLRNRRVSRARAPPPPLHVPVLSLKPYKAVRRLESACARTTGGVRACLNMMNILGSKDGVNKQFVLNALIQPSPTGCHAGRHWNCVQARAALGWRQECCCSRATTPSLLQETQCSQHPAIFT